MAVTLGTKNEARFGQKITLYSAGTIQISDTGTFEVESDEVAKDVTDTYEEFFVVGSEKTDSNNTTTKTKEELGNKSEQDELNKKNGDELGAGDNGEVSNDDLIKSLDNKTFDELKVLAKPFPKKEWNQLDQPSLIEFLKAKLTE